MDSCSLIELVRRLRSDDVKAFNTLYYEYHYALYSNIFKLCKDVDVTQDLVQDVFITLWEKPFTIDPNKLVSNWLFTVSYNKSINYLKKTLRRSVELADHDGKIPAVYDEELNVSENPNPNNSVTSSLYLRDASYIRLKSVDYTFACCTIYLNILQQRLPRPQRKKFHPGRENI